MVVSVVSMVAPIVGEWRMNENAEPPRGVMPFWVLAGSRDLDPPPISDEEKDTIRRLLRAANTPEARRQVAHARAMRPLEAEIIEIDHQLAALGVPNTPYEAAEA
jgi:hypothetical protein